MRSEEYQYSDADEIRGRKVDTEDMNAIEQTRRIRTSITLGDWDPRSTCISHNFTSFFTAARNIKNDDDDIPDGPTQFPAAKLGEFTTTGDIAEGTFDNSRVCFSPS